MSTFYTDENGVQRCMVCDAPGEVSDNHLDSIRREIFAARWYVAGLLTYAKGSENWTNAQNAEFLQRCIEDAQETLNKMDAEARRRQQVGNE